MEALQSIGQFFARWLAQLEATFVEKQRYLLLVDGLKNTLIITLGALVIGVVIGSLVAMIKYCGQDSRLLRPLCWLCSVYTTVIRGVPVVVQLLIFYFLILKSSDGLVVGIVTFGINSGAYVAEIFRGGIESIDKGQMEAGRSLGMTWWQTMRHIILPQAFKRIIPPLGNEFIAMLKDSSLVSVIGFEELTRRGQLIIARTYASFEIWLSVAIIYLVMTFAVARLVGVLERRYKKDEQ